MGKCFALLFLLVGFNSLIAQPLDFTKLTFTEIPFFNDKWVKNHQISSIYVTISYKMDKKPIVSSDQMRGYFFNKSGQLVRVVETIQIQHRMDTAETFYYYDTKERLTKRVIKDAYGYYALSYNYDALGLINGITHSRVRKDLNGFFRNESIVWKDSIANQKKDQLVNRVYYNQQGMPYMDEHVKLDESGMVIQSMKINRIGGETHLADFKRGEQGEIVQYEWVNAYTKIKRTVAKKYNEQLFLESEEERVDGLLEKTTRITYTDNNAIELRLIRNSKTKRMEINQFRYEYY